jgi:hypothetical protein
MDLYQRRRLVALSILAGVFILIVLLIRSCGGDDEETPVTPVAGTTGAGGATSLSQSDYGEEADNTCLEANTALAAIDQTDPTAAATEEGQIIAGQLEALQTLPPPTEGADDLESFLTALQDQIATYDRYLTALERGDDTAVAELETAIDEAAAKVEKEAKQFGFEVCGDTAQVGETSGAEGEGESATEAAPEAGATEAAPTVPVEPAAPAPEAPAPAFEPAPAPAPAPAAGGGASPAPAPAPAPADGGTGSGGISP